MTIEFQDVLQANVVLPGVGLLSQPNQQDEFAGSVGGELVKEVMSPPPPFLANPASGQETGLLLKLPRNRIQLLLTPARSSIEREYPAVIEDLDRLAEVASRAIELTSLEGQSPLAYGFNIELVYRPMVAQSSERYLAKRLFRHQQYGIKEWALAGGGGKLSFEGADARWNFTVEPRANDPSGRKVFLSLNLHKDRQEVPSREEIVASLRDIWNRSRTFAIQLDASA